MSGTQQEQDLTFSSRKSRGDRRPPATGGRVVPVVHSGLVVLSSLGLLILMTAGLGSDAYVLPLPALRETSSISLLQLRSARAENVPREAATSQRSTSTARFDDVPRVGRKALPDEPDRPVKSDNHSVHSTAAKASRVALTSLLSAILVATASFLPSAVPIIGGPQPAHATYSAYTRREQDWSERTNAGQVQYSSARALKKQLRDIAPMNTQKSLLFCPNGPSSNVSPLMENRCGDQMATPSVFGRTEDVVGNSIPGFSSRPTSNDGLLTPASVGGFLPYGGANSK